MSNQKNVTEKLDSVKLIQLLVKWRKQLIIIGVASLIVSFTFTLPVFMTPMYKATTIIYPVNLKAYSKESPTEQMVQYLSSEDVLEKLIKPFNLYYHYEIDSAGKYPRFEILKQIRQNVEVDKTEFESIEINIWDRDPDIAAKMCDSLVYFADQKALTILKESSMELYKVLKRQLDERKYELDSMENAIKILRVNYGITDFENQVEGFSREYYNSLRTGSVNLKMETTQKNLQEKGGEYILLKELLWRVRGNYYDVKLQYDRTLSDIEKNISFHSTVSTAAPPERKDYPHRTLIMLLFTASVLFFAVIIIIFKEHYRKFLLEDVIKDFNERY